MKLSTKSAILTAIVIGILAPGMKVQADTTAATPGQFAKNHPRRAEVNRRFRRQNRRINQGVKKGELTPQQAQQLKANDASIKAQERADVKANGGYLTKPEQRQLNQEENANSKLIRDEKHPAGQ